MARYEVMAAVAAHSLDKCEVIDHEAHPYRQVVCRGSKKNCDEIAALLNAQQGAAGDAEPVQRR